MSSSEASEAARYYKSLTSDEQSAIIDASLEKILKMDDGRFGLITKDFYDLVVELHLIGRFEQYVNFSLEQRLTVLREIENDAVPVETFFLLDDLQNGIHFLRINMEKGQQFREFNRNLDRATLVQFKNDGSIKFRESLHRYFDAFGKSTEKDPDGLKTPKWWPRPDDSDPYITLSAFLLLAVCDESRVTALINHIVDEKCPIQASDFIKIVQSDVDFTSYPISWSTTLV